MEPRFFYESTKLIEIREQNEAQNGQREIFERMRQTMPEFLLNAENEKNEEKKSLKLVGTGLVTNAKYKKNQQFCEDITIRNCDSGKSIFIHLSISLPGGGMGGMGRSTVQPYLS